MYRERKRGRPARVLVEPERLHKLEAVEAACNAALALARAGRHACPAVETLARILTHAAA